MRPQKINVIVYAPHSDAGKQSLAERVASVHADAVLSQIKHLPCSDTQKQKLLNEIIADARKCTREENDISSTPTDMYK